MPDNGPLAGLVTGLIPPFLLTLARVSGVAIFIPMPTIRNAAAPIRISFTIALAAILTPITGQTQEWPTTIPSAIWALPSEVALGLTAGLIAGWVNEAFLMAMQFVSAQAGFTYASTIDPSTQVDIAVLQMFAQLAAGILFFLAGLDREVIRAFALSFSCFPPGTFEIRPDMLAGITQLSSAAIGLGIRLALPVIALLALVDLALALAGRFQTQLQLLSLAFPVKTLLSLLMISLLWGAFPRAYEAIAADGAKLLSESIGRRP